MTSELYKTVLLCGAPGAGKGTQGKILGSIPGFFHLSCGDVFRTININSELGQKICEYTARGDLVPDDITVELWHRAISNQGGLAAGDGQSRVLAQLSLKCMPNTSY